MAGVLSYTHRVAVAAHFLDCLQLGVVFITVCIQLP
jgi:hypothetical protein